MTSAGACELSVVVVTYGARDQAFECLGSLQREATGKNWEVLVVDNGSRNGLARELASAFPEFRHVRNASNTGFATAANLGASAARGTHVLFLNPDTVVLEGAIADLLEFACTRPEAGIWGGRTLFADGRTNPAACRRFPTLWNLFCSALALDTRFPESPVFGGMNYDKATLQRVTPVDVICGCYLLIDRRLWDRLGGFSPAFFMYGEDDELCLRARRLGYHPTYTPHAAIVHHGSGTEAVQERKLAQIFAARSLLIRAYFSVPARQLGLGLMLVRPWLGRRLAKPGLRSLWENIWKRRRDWLAGRFAT